MDPNQQRQRLAVIQASSPSLRAAAAPNQPTLSAGVAHPGNLTVADANGNVTPQSTVIKPGGGTAGGPQSQDNNSAPLQDTNTFAHALDFAGNALHPLVSPFEYLGKVDMIDPARELAASITGNHAAEAAQNIRSNRDLGLGDNGTDLAGGLKKWAGNSAQVGLDLLGPEALGAKSLVGKTAADSLMGAGYGASNTLADNPNATLGDYFKNAAIGGVAGGGLRVGFTGLGKLFGRGADSTAVGMDPATLNFIKNSKDPNEIHDVLSSIYGGSSDALKQAAVDIAHSNNSKFIVKSLADLPVEGGIAEALAGAASNAVARDKYGVDALTGETASPQAPTPQTPQTIELNPYGGNTPVNPAEGAPGIQLNADHQPATDTSNPAANPQEAQAATVNPHTAGLTPEEVQAIHEAGVQVDNTPAYQRGIPSTVGEAASQANSGVFNAPEDAFNADARTKALGEPGTDPSVEIPAYIRQNPDAAATDAKAQMDRIDKLLENIGTPQSQKFAARQQLADQLRSNPDAKDAIIANYERQLNSYNPDEVQATKNALLAERQKYQSIINHAETAKHLPSGETATEEVAQTAAKSKEAAGAVTTPPEATATPIQSTEAPANPVAPAGEPSAAREALINGLGDASKQAKADATSLTAGRAQRAATATAQTTGLEGEQATAARLSAFKGAYGHKGEYAGIGGDQGQQIFDQLRLEAQRNPELANRPFELTNVETALKKAVLGEDLKGAKGAPTQADVALLRRHFGDEVGTAVQDAVDSSQSTLQKGLGVAGDIAGLPKSVMASWDLSATLRQGGVLASRFPKEAAQAFKDQIKSFASEDGFKQAAESLHADPFFDNGQAHGLATDAIAGAISGTEEQFVSNLAERMHLPGIARSDRAYSMYLASIRQRVYSNILQGYEDSGRQLSDKEMGDLAKFVNTATGRGDLGQYLEQHSQSLSTALFSPRLWKSRLDMLNPVYYAKLSGPARKYALQSASTFAGEAATVLGLASLVPGVSVETDMRSSDFGKIKVGNTRYDLLGGFQQNLVFAWRELTGEQKNSETGKVSKFASGITDLFNPNHPQPSSGIMSKTRLSLFGSMIQNKENPLLSTASQILQGKDRGGHPINPITALAQLAIPLPVSGAFQNAQDIGSWKNVKDDLKGAAMNIPDTLGISTQTYGAIATKNKGQPTTPGGEATYKGAIAPNMVTDYNGKVILDKNGLPVTATIPPNATEAERQAIIDAHRESAVRGQYVRSLPEKDQIYANMNDTLLKQYVKDGKMSQADYDHIQNVKTQINSVSKGNDYKVPDGVKTPEATAFYQKWNSMDAKDQKAWLKQPADPNSTALVQKLNATRNAGLDEFKPSNQLAQLYSKYEADINSHPEYDDIEKQNKAKAFQINAAKLNQNKVVQDMYGEGGSADMKALIAGGKITSDNLQAAINLDNQLYNAGLESSLKFSKSFRKTYGMGLPAGPGGTGTGSGSGGSGGGRGGSGKPSTNPDIAAGQYYINPTTGQKVAITGHLDSLIPTLNKNPGGTKPTFSAAQRATPISVVKFKAPNSNEIQPATGSQRVTAGPFRTTTLTRKRNSVGI